MNTSNESKAVINFPRERKETVLLAPELETNQGEMKALRSEKMGALNDQCRTLKRFQSSAEKYDQSDWERKRLEK
jgi:hypothetical protein